MGRNAGRVVGTNTLNEQSITYWFDQLRAGNEVAAARLWDHYFQQLATFARRRLHQRRVSDEEDLAAEVLQALCRAADVGRLPAIQSRDDLWRILLSWMRNKITDQVRAQQAAKRGGGRVRGQSGFGSGDGDAFAEPVCPQPSAATLAELRELADRLLRRLPDVLLRELALARMAGKTVGELSVDFKIAPRTVERKLAIIRRVWSDDAPE